MARKRKHHDPPELDITAFLNLMVVLVPFLLITAAFSRITILQLNLPASSGASSGDKKELTIEVIVREKRIELGDGKQIVTRLSNNPDDGTYDFKALTKLLLDIKANFPYKLDATVLMEPDLKYEALVQVMDAVSGTEAVDANGEKKKIELFPQISIGDAPGGKVK